MLITNGTLVTPGMRRRTIHRQVSFGPITLRIASVVFLAAAALIFLAQSTGSATKSYKEQQLKDQIATQQQEVDHMKTETARLQALNTIMKSTEASPTPSPSAALEKPQSINYIQADNQPSVSQATTVNPLP